MLAHFSGSIHGLGMYLDDHERLMLTDATSLHPRLWRPG